MKASKGRLVELVIAGRRYRVKTTAGEQELKELVSIVESRVSAVGGGRGATPETILLAAISLAHDLVECRAKSERDADRARGLANDMLRRVEAVLDDSEGEDGPGK